MLLGVVLVAVALVDVVDVLTGVVLVIIALVDVVHMARLVAVMLVIVALMNVMDMLASVMFVVVAFVDVVLCSHHSCLLAINPAPVWYTLILYDSRVSQKRKVVKPI